jgi:hypothetical protein
MGLTTLLDVHNSRAAATKTTPVRRALLDVKNAAVPAGRTTLLDSKKAAPGVVGSGGALARPPALPPGVTLPFIGSTLSDLAKYINANTTTTTTNEYVRLAFNKIIDDTKLDALDQKYVEYFEAKRDGTTKDSGLKPKLVNLMAIGSLFKTNTSKMDAINKSITTATRDALITIGMTTSKNTKEREHLLLFRSLIDEGKKTPFKQTADYLRANAKIPDTEKFVLKPNALDYASAELPFDYIWKHAKNVTRKEFMAKLFNENTNLININKVMASHKNRVSIHVDHLTNDIDVGSMGIRLTQNKTSDLVTKMKSKPELFIKRVDKGDTYGTLTDFNKAMRSNTLSTFIQLLAVTQTPEDKKVAAEAKRLQEEAEKKRLEDEAKIEAERIIKEKKRLQDEAEQKRLEDETKRLREEADKKLADDIAAEAKRALEAIGTETKRALEAESAKFDELASLATAGKSVSVAATEGLRKVPHTKPKQKSKRKSNRLFADTEMFPLIEAKTGIRIIKQRANTLRYNSIPFLIRLPPLDSIDEFPGVIPTFIEQVKLHYRNRDANTPPTFIAPIAKTNVYTEKGIQVIDVINLYKKLKGPDPTNSAFK